MCNLYLLSVNFLDNHSSNGKVLEIWNLKAGRYEFKASFFYLAECKILQVDHRKHFLIYNYNHGHNIWEFLMFYQIFLSPQVEWSLIISNKLEYMSCLMSCQTT